MLPCQKMDSSFLGGARNKAGMPDSGGLERKKIDEIIQEASRGSKFFEYQKKREERVMDRIEKLKQKKVQLERMFERDHLAYERAKKDVERLVINLESQRDLSRTFVCVDMDAFFAAVETLEHPEWANIPMAVGGTSMLCTANYAARKYGVVSAMPGYIALKLCPHLRIVPLDFEKYKQAASKFHQVFAKYDQNFTHFSLDEATLDVTEALRSTQMSAEELVGRMRAEVTEITGGLTCSAGIAPNRMLAKICSNIHKPKGQYYLPNDLDSIKAFIRDTRVVKVNGIGKVTAKVLEGVLGSVTLGQLWEERIWIKLLFSEIQTEFLLKCCLGLGSSFNGFDSDGDRQSMSCERTFGVLNKTEDILQVLQDICEELAHQLENEGLAGKNVTVKMKAADFSVTTRAMTLKKFISSAQEIYHHSRQILLKHRPADLRLLGVRMAALDTTDAIDGDADISQYFDRIDDSKPLIKCPICLLPVKGTHEDDEEFQRVLNDHMDTCLAKQIAAHENLDLLASSNEKQRELKRKSSGALDHYFKRSKRT